MLHYLFILYVASGVFLCMRALRRNWRIGMYWLKLGNCLTIFDESPKFQFYAKWEKSFMLSICIFHYYAMRTLTSCLHFFNFNFSKITRTRIEISMPEETFLKPIFRQTRHDLFICTAALKRIPTHHKINQRNWNESTNNFFH